MDQVSVPAKQGVGPDEEAREVLAGKQSGQSGEQRPISRLERGSADLAFEHRHLVAEHDDLDRQVHIRATRESD